MRNWLVAACAIWFAGLLAGMILPARLLDRVGPVTVGGAFDVAIFYCAARQTGRSDPYALEPLASCERTALPQLFSDVPAPSPQPGYVLAAMAPLAALSERRFAFIWIVTLLALATAAGGALARLSGFPGYGVFCGLVLGPGFENLQLGQLSMLVLVGVSGAAYALRANRPRAAAVLLGLALAEPHVALPAIAGLFVLEPRSRVTLAAVCAFALALFLGTFGPAIAWEYVARMLPLQAFSEARNVEQYSATVLATLLGASDVAAVRIGDLQYAALAIAAIAWAKRLRDRFGDASFVVAIPAAAAVIGGPYVHMSELLALCPAAILLAQRARGRKRIVAAIALALLAYPWRVSGSIATRVFVDGLYCVVAFAIASRWQPKRVWATCAAIAASVLALGAAVQQSPATALVAIPAQISSLVAETAWDGNLSPLPWAIHMRLTHNVLTWHELAMHLPPFVIFALLLTLAVTAARSRPAAGLTVAPGK